ncbi:MAG TPA: hypothetical protein VN634_08125 [Candidatus Limnocylindrales bacterium]|nr:hypothetical protein [Candidatus Limnocylindrales bacterium]
MQIRRYGAVAAACAVILLSAAHAHALTATIADDVCASDADPCNITGPVDVTDGAVLDFQTRTVNVTGAGQLNFGDGEGTILSGLFHAATTEPAIRSRVTLGSGQTESGKITITTRRLCSTGGPADTCETNASCQLGTCGYYRCSGNAQLICTSDDRCQAGPCNGSSCTNSESYFSCSTNADCDFGACGSQPTCSRLHEGTSVACADDADCDLGTCTVGDGSIMIGGGIDGRSDAPASVTLRAAGSVSIAGDVDLSCSADYAAGSLTVHALDGDASISGEIRATANLWRGGHVSIDASQDTVISAPIDLTGSNYYDVDGLELAAGRDITIAARINVSSRTNGGWGGRITAIADRDILVDGNRTFSLLANGYGSSYFSDDGGGNGGEVDLEAGGKVTIASDVRVAANGAVPYGAGGALLVYGGVNVKLGGRISANSSGSGGGWLYVESGGDVQLDGQFSGKSLAFDYGYGGYAEIFADGDVVVSESGDVNLAATDGGILEIRAGGNVDFRGHANASAKSSGYGGSVQLFSDHANVGVPGVIKIRGEDGEIEIDGCNVELSGSLSSHGEGTYTTLTAFDDLTTLAGSSVRTSGGQSWMRYAHADNPPVILGNVSPVAGLVIGLGRADCPYCGNSEVDDGETCDDGNTEAGDGCDGGCHTE